MQQLLTFTDNLYGNHSHAFSITQKILRPAILSQTKVGALPEGKSGGGGVVGSQYIPSIMQCFLWPKCCAKYFLWPKCNASHGPSASCGPNACVHACVRVCKGRCADELQLTDNYTQVLQRLTSGRIKSLESTQAASCCGARPSSDFEDKACPGQCFRMLQQRLSSVVGHENA